MMILMMIIIGIRITGRMVVTILAGEPLSVIIRIRIIRRPKPVSRPSTL